MSRWLAVVLAGALAAQAHAGDLKFSGYYKNLFIGSETIVGAEERYSLDLSRMRLALKGEVLPHTDIDLQYDNELLLGSYLRRAQFTMAKDQRPDQLWDLDWKYGEGGGWYGRHRMYRASVDFSLGRTDVRLGRQRIAWGTGRFWSPVDLLNPLNPIALEREERLGVDAVVLERKLGPLSRISVVYAPRQERGASSAAVNWHANAAGIDYSLIGGNFRNVHVFGGDLATQVGGAGLRAEITANDPDQGNSFIRGVVATDYAFASSLTLSAELYYNGAGTANREAYDFTSLLTGRIQNVGRRYLGVHASYEITPLIKWVNYLVVNLSDRSRFFAPSLAFSLRADLDLTLGAQLFSGGVGTEYRRLPDVYFAQLQWFF